MISIADDMKMLIDNALADRMPCLIGTASRDGAPQISIKGSMMVYDAETLAYWERAKQSAFENLSENPRVVVFYRNPRERITWRFHGEATVHELGAIRDGVMGRVVERELERDADRMGVAVLIRVDSITELSGRVLQQRGDE